MDQQPAKNKAIKCVVWDLDQTLWEGVLLEDDRVSLRSNIPDIIKTLDSRGIMLVPLTTAMLKSKSS